MKKYPAESLFNKAAILGKNLSDWNLILTNGTRMEIVNIICGKVVVGWKIFHQPQGREIVVLFQARNNEQRSLDVAVILSFGQSDSCKFCVYSP